MLRPQSGKNAFDFCGGLMANTANLRCIRKNIGYVCADGFWSSAEILENSLVLAKMQILQNARSVWLRVMFLQFALNIWEKNTARVCVGREFARAMSKTAGLATLCSFPNKAGDDGNSSFSKCIQKRIAKTRRTGDSAFLPPCRIHVDLTSRPA